MSIMAKLFGASFAVLGIPKSKLKTKYRELSVLQHVDHRVGRLLPLFNGFGALVKAVILAATAK